LRRFLMTEPIRPTSLRHNGNGHAITHRRPGGWAHARNIERNVNAYRSRSPLAYLLRRRRETDRSSFRRRAPRQHGKRRRQAGLPKELPRHPWPCPRHGAGAGSRLLSVRAGLMRSRLLRSGPPGRTPGGTGGSPVLTGKGCKRQLLDAARESGLPALSSQNVRSGSPDEGRPQVLVNRLLGDPERTSDPYGF
jgi:hypothetical protein